MRAHDCGGPDLCPRCDDAPEQLEPTPVDLPAPGEVWVRTWGEPQLIGPSVEWRDEVVVQRLKSRDGRPVWILAGGELFSPERWLRQGWRRG